MTQSLILGFKRQAEYQKNKAAGQYTLPLPKDEWADHTSKSSHQAPDIFSVCLENECLSETLLISYILP